eukprot:TRINITY_DN34581_c0_g1_i1.p1 TRINITY_DN34581_c0_g1~~TRINITY_DN34581_c0_g1_i1.p1  ORF type:complete len:177 (-),score=32.99 TRINITY_DN34581_c0_g1_i1:56-526(-)
MKVILREWQDIEMEDEFRVFVYNGAVTAISQYFHFLYFPSLQGTESQIAEVILEFMGAHILPVLKQHEIPHVVVDVMLTAEGGSSCKVIELNPIGYATGAMLLDWRRDRDVLTKGPLEVRFRHNPRTNFSGVTLLPASQCKPLLLKVLGCDVDWFD